MTRINVVPASELNQKELGGEWKELPRTFTLIKARVAKGQLPCDIKAPSEYVLGKGHVMFFFTRVKYLVDRYTELCNEMLNRGYKPNLEMFNDIIDDVESCIPLAWWGDYIPTASAIDMNVQRMIDNGTR